MGEQFRGYKTEFSMEISEAFFPPEEGTEQLRYLIDLFLAPEGEGVVMLDMADVMVFLAHPRENTCCRLYFICGEVEQIVRCLSNLEPCPSNTHILQRFFYGKDQECLEVLEPLEAAHRKRVGPDALVFTAADLDEDLQDSCVRLVVLEVTN